MIRRISKGESQLYKKLRLKALKDAPSAFASNYEEALLRNDESWQAQSDAASNGEDKAIFIIQKSNKYGMVAIYRKSKNSTVGELFQMWVSPEARGSSIAKDLLLYSLIWAANNGYSKIVANVTKGNTRALQFYKNYGFTASLHSIDPDTHTLETTPLI